MTARKSTQLRESAPVGKRAANGPLELVLKLPTYWQQERRIQRALRDAEAVLEREAVSDETAREIYQHWKGEQGRLKYLALERQVIDGEGAPFPDIGVEAFELITSVLLLAIGHEIGCAIAAKDEAGRQALFLFAYAYAVNLYAARSIVRSRALSALQAAKARKVRVDWSSVDEWAGKLRGKVPDRNLASAIAIKTGRSTKGIRKRLRKMKAT